MKRGRPRQFDVDDALDRAVQVFWRQGYDGTSLSDLTEALGITRPSLYAAFGNKEALFRKAIDRYAEGSATFLARAVEARTARGVAEELFRGAARFHADPRNPRGCLVTHGALVGDAASAAACRATRNRRTEFREMIRDRLELAQREGDLPAGTDPAGLALYMVTVLRGMAVEAASGASPEDLDRIADIALGAWPAAAARA